MNDFKRGFEHLRADNNLLPEPRISMYGRERTQSGGSELKNYKKMNILKRDT